ncbi:fasciclin domain-containing protein [Dolichospermum sp. UHCC 0259]|uniref:fasciclin domain-containing protein n=1 Tax=Dolichospermum sp. UHCC 0259 TaxID=2590010 RepID=UPI0014478C50|nr:fasciclin domain-containing protein [Dolichospermum sp. UHCC 0259]MTJ48538.1 fasciclin domain-containing protein [Dolichospermum sp. UHCC 0259]
MNSIFAKTLAIAVAATTFFVSVPTFAESQSAPRSKKPDISTTNVGTIIDVASSNSSLKTLVTAIKAAGLVETLSGQGPFTVFAPTDAAFAALPKGTLEKLLKPENKGTLVKILTYHVVPGAVYAKDIKSGAVKTVEGQPVDIQAEKGVVSVGNAKVTKADVKASNGVIHVINKVLLPPDVRL